jgi:peptidoglycan/LPS O-acetylase OafA/YrhL
VLDLVHGIDKKAGDVLDHSWFGEAPFQLAASLAVALLLYHFYDRPVVRWLNRRRSVLGVDISRTYRPPISPVG